VGSHDSECYDHGCPNLFVLNAVSIQRALTSRLYETASERVFVRQLPDNLSWPDRQESLLTCSWFHLVSPEKEKNCSFEIASHLTRL
jgi:hypothetical protein